MHRQNIQPEALAQRVVDGRVLYSHVVVVEGHRMIFVAGQLARDAHGNVVGKGDMRAQLRQVGENIQWSDKKLRYRDACRWYDGWPTHPGQGGNHHGIPLACRDGIHTPGTHSRGAVVPDVWRRADHL